MTEIYSESLTGARIRSTTMAGVVFDIERQLGEGGTASAYLGVRRSPSGDAPVVVKIMLPALVARAGKTASLVARKEVESLARVSSRIPPNPFVIRLFDAGAIAYRSAGAIVELPWLAIEYVHGGVEGTTLEDRIDHSVRTTGFAFDRARVARVVEHVCSGLDEVHAVGVIHRDLTPNNVLCCGVGGAEVFKLSDFGIARPEGMELTFNARVLGTPGYMPPEQLGVGEVSVVSDIFALAALTYRALAGEEYFAARTPLEALTQAQAAERRSLLDAKTLSSELAAQPGLCRELDQVLARATHADPKERPGSARIFAGTLLPLLTTPGAAAPTSIRARTAIPQLVRVAPDARWMVRHPPGDDRVITSAAWDSDGHCLAATSRGLELWDGAAWHPAPDEELPVLRGTRCVFRTGPGRWLVGGERGAVAEYGGLGAQRIFRGPDPAWCFTAASGDPHDLCVFVAQSSGQTPLLCTCVGDRWLKPIPLVEATYVGALARLDDERWVLAGRATSGRGFACVVSPLHWRVEMLSVPTTRAYVAAAGQHERSLALVAGVEGRVLEVEGSETRIIDLPESTDASACAIDIVGRRWVGAAGVLWVGGGGGWAKGWQDASWRAPFISLYADVGLVVAMTADGGVLENRASRSEISAAMVRRISSLPS
jgi:serine/threonine protein kinase